MCSEQFSRSIKLTVYLYIMLKSRIHKASCFGTEVNFLLFKNAMKLVFKSKQKLNSNAI
jgi:hypothetical protein